MSALTLLLLGLLPSLAALRPELTILSSRADGEKEATSSSLMEAEGQGRDQADPPSRVRVVTAKPGPLGIFWNPNTGKLLEVMSGSQGEKLGLKAGEHFIRLGKQKFRLIPFQKAAKGSRPYEISVESPTKMEQNMEQAFQVLAMPLGLLGLVLVLGLPWVIYSHLTMSDSQQQNGFSKALSHPLPLTMMLAFAFAQSGLALLEWPYTRILTKVYDTINNLHVVGLVLGLHLNRNNIALSKPLSSSYASLLRWTELVALNICAIAVLSSAAVVAKVYIYNPCTTKTGCSFKPSDVPKMLLDVCGQRIPTFFAQFVFTCYVARITLATRQQMFEVQSKMPCKPTEFSECVQKPCAVLLDNSIPELVTCGWPLVLAAPNTVVSGFDSYQSLTVLFVNPYMYETWLSFFANTAHCAAVLLAVAVGPLHLSSALKDFQKRLNEERQRDATLHTQIKGVERMLEKHNCGKGFGIPVFDGFVLTKGLLQYVCIRLALVGATIKSIVDAELGFAKEPEEVLGPTLGSIKSVLHNITMLLTA
eukprot:symbB.v1.2.013103.t1/scaffold919.1/size152209/15